MLILRAQTKHHLKQIGLPKGWTDTGKTSLHSQISLISPQLNTYKLLRARFDYGARGLPVAGHSKARQAFYSQDTLVGENRIIFMGLKDETNLELGLRFKIGAPEVPGKYGHPLPLKWLAELDARDEDYLYSSFESAEENIDLFIHALQDENEESI